MCRPAERDPGSDEMCPAIKLPRSTPSRTHHSDRSDSAHSASMAAGIPTALWHGAPAGAGGQSGHTVGRPKANAPYAAFPLGKAALLEPDWAHSNRESALARNGTARWGRGEDRNRKTVEKKPAAGSLLKTSLRTRSKKWGLVTALTRLQEPRSPDLRCSRVTFAQR